MILDTLDAVKLQQTLALIKPDAYQHQQLIVYRILQEGFTIVHQKSFQFTQDQAALFYREHEHQPFYSTLTEWMASAPVYALILEKEDAIQSWRTLMGPTDANKARATEPTSLRALYGTDGSRNAVHGSDCSTSAQREINLVFDQQREPVTSTNTLAPDNNNAQAPTPATVTAIVDAQPHDLATDEPALPQPSKHDADSDQHHDHSDIHVLESLKVGQPDMLVDQDAMVPHQPADLNGTDNGLSASHESPAPVQRLPDTNQTNDSPVTLHLDVSELDAPAPALTDADVPVSPEPEAQHDTADAVLPVESNTLNEQETIAVDHPSLDHIAHGQVAMDAEPALDLITTSAAPEDAAKDEYSTDVLTEEAVTKEADADATLEPVSTAVVVEASEVKDVNDQYPSEDKMAIVHHDSHDAATQDLTKDESAVEDIMMDTPAVLAEEAPNTQTPKVDDEPVLEAR
ncbi:hypothetical protein DM01DRAFT_1397697 [Hesseltinella vesiculosa]|uniref:Nucleoside diphosphate kinase n=1 Tax=Hesseltinella vesiculosa TaxID=101127 RepID=A0A1X2GT11_9FUNG|nr:hypothetical protein DM01DRAFT_1397697 [Hesseltinella vesiculosa]